MPTTDPTPAVRVTARMPKQANNGLPAIVDDLISHPRAVRVAIVSFTVSKLIEDIDNGETVPIVELLRIEPVTGTPMKRAQKLLEDAATVRTGDTLPADEWNDRYEAIDEPASDDE